MAKLENNSEKNSVIQRLLELAVQSGCITC